MSVQKIKGKWWARIKVKDADESWRQLCIPGGFATKQDALDAVAASKAMRRDVRQRERMSSYLQTLTGKPEEGRSVSLAAMWTRYIGLPGIKLAATTETFRRMVVARFVKWMKKRHPELKSMGDVERTVAAEYLDHLHREKKSGKTINNTRGDLSAVWTALLIREGLKENVWKVVPAFRTDDSVSGRDFTEKEIAAILKAARAVGRQWPEICVAGLYTGLRYGDLLRLRWADIKEGCIYLTPAKTERHGTQVAVPVHPHLREVLDGIDRNGPLVFWDQAARLHSSRRVREFGEILQAAKVKSHAGEKLSFHCFRHTFRTRLSAAGVAADVAKRLGGWKSDVDAKVYDHDVVSLRKAIDALQ